MGNLKLDKSQVFDTYLKLYAIYLKIIYFIELILLLFNNLLSKFICILLFVEHLQIKCYIKYLL